MIHDMFRDISCSKNILRCFLVTVLVSNACWSFSITPYHKPRGCHPAVSRFAVSQLSVSQSGTEEKRFNVVLTHCNADFDSLASAVGLAKLWSKGEATQQNSSFTTVEEILPTYVVLPRGAHPGVQRFLALHEHLFPIRTLRSVSADLQYLNRLGLVDAQRRDRVGPAEHLLSAAKSVTIVDHHIDGQSDIPEATEYIVDKIGSVSSLIAESIQNSQLSLTEIEATLLALGIHADTGSLCFDSTTPRDALALAWVMQQGASQTAIAEHVHAKLSWEQQEVLTQALLNLNSTKVHGVTISTVMLTMDGFINGLAAVTQDALDLSGSDVLLLSMVYDAKTTSKQNKKKGNTFRITNKIANLFAQSTTTSDDEYYSRAEAWKGGHEALKSKRIRYAFDQKDNDGNGYLDRSEIKNTVASSGIFASDKIIDSIFSEFDANGDDKLSFSEFKTFLAKLEKLQKLSSHNKRASTMVIIGRVKPGVTLKHVNLNKLLSKLGGGGHAKAASVTLRLQNDNEAMEILQGVVDELVDTSLTQQLTVGDFMTSPVLSAKPHMTENQVEDLFTRYDVRALPVVDQNYDVVGIVTNTEVAAAKQRLFNKEQKRLKHQLISNSTQTSDKVKKRKLGSALKGWMKQHVRIVEASMTMPEVEAAFLENDVGCIPVVADGTKTLVGMVTRTDLLRQHRYYSSLHYHNKGFSNSIADRKPIIELRKKLKQFDLDE